MTKEEFLSELRSSLSGSVSAEVINENINYYENFINTQTRKGMDLDEVLEELGSPRLLAKTIIDTAPAGERRTMDGSSDEPSGSDHSDFIMPWWMIIIAVFAVILVIFLLFTFVSAIIPVLIVLAIVFLVIKVLGKGR